MNRWSFSFCSIFLLASGDFFLRKLIKVLPTLSDKKRALTITNTMQREISRYFLTVTLINAGLGLAVGTALYFIGMPTPYLWGAMAFALNFIPYLGALVGIVLTAAVALVSFDSIGQALLAPAAYLALATLEGNFITPTIMGKRFTLNPVVVFIWLIFWGWLWGVIGAFDRRADARRPENPLRPYRRPRHTRRVPGRLTIASTACQGHRFPGNHDFRHRDRALPHLQERPPTFKSYDPPAAGGAQEAAEVFPDFRINGQRLIDRVIACPRQRLEQARNSTSPGHTNGRTRIR